MTRRRTALKGLALGATTVAATAVSGLTGTAAYAAPQAVAYDCVVFGSHFDYNATLTATAPSGNVGEEVTVSVGFSDLPGAAPLPTDKWTSSGTVAVSGAQTGDLAISAPEKLGPVAAKAPLPLGTLTGKLALTKAGSVDVSPGPLKIIATASGANVTINCTPKASGPVLVSIPVGTGVPAATFTVNPVSVAPGNAFTVGGTGWESGPVTLTLCDAAGAACGADGLTDASASAGADGKLTGGAKIKAGVAFGAHKIKVTQGEVSKTADVTVFDDTPPAGACAGTPSTQCGEQTINVTVTGGPLTMAQESATVDLTPVTLDGDPKTSTGDLKQVKVQDARGASKGWSLVGTLTDFSGPAGAKIAAGNLSWTPKCAAHEGATPVTTGTPGPLGATGATLCSTADSTTGPVGGVYDADAGLSLKVPAVTGTGQYQAILTITLS